METTKNTGKKVAIIGGGPAGLMAAQEAVKAGLLVSVYDAMPSVGRKFLLAGKGGLNLTHSEAFEPFLSRYGARQDAVGALLKQFGATEVQTWAQGLGVETFVGSSGRVFPKDMKAAPLLRAWLHQLRAAGVQFHMRYRWLGWAAASDVGASDSTGHALQFSSPQGAVTVQADGVVLALGGGSWARLGSDGAWVDVLSAQGVPVKPLLPSNCGFDLSTAWTEHFSSRFAGQPFKTVAITVRSDAETQPRFSRQGEFVATVTGVEGSLIYAASSLLRDDIAVHGRATFYLDLLPDRTPAQVLTEVKHPRGSRSLSSHLKSRLKIDGIKAAVLHEMLSKEDLNQPETLAAAIKALPIHLAAARPLDEAISSAGGVAFEGLNADLMVKPGVFCAGEMLDWEAPTGGYLITACLSSGAQAGRGVAAYVAN